MTTGAGRLDRRLGVRILVFVALVAFDATGLRYFFAVSDAVISVFRADAFTFIRRDRGIRRLVAVKACQHLFHLGVLVSMVAVLTLIRVFRLSVICVIEV